ncbi:MAG: hypothetical protein ACE14L_07315 [Terriglobales bacterium]
MPRMLELIRASAVPASLLRSAALGALSLPAAEMLEVLVYLTGQPMWAATARLTLAGWDAGSAAAVVSDPQAPPSVLEYFSLPENHRPALLPALIENAALPEQRLINMAQTASREVLDLMLASVRARALPDVVRALLLHPELTDEERERLSADLERAGLMVSDSPGQDIFEPDLTQYLREHATEIAAEEGKPFHLIDWTAEEQAEIAAPASGVSSSVAAAQLLGLAARAERDERPTIVQKIAKMSVGERVQLALKGNKDERFILIRDGAKVVSSAVLESPKITDQEVETFASMKNVGEHVLRIIAAKRKFIRNYSVKRMLTANPRCPLDVSLPLVKELLVMDLKNLMRNKNVADTVRKFAWKMWKEKAGANR